jgi:hypothetical protein
LSNINIRKIYNKKSQEPEEDVIDTLSIVPHPRLARVSHDFVVFLLSRNKRACKRVPAVKSRFNNDHNIPPVNKFIEPMLQKQMI